MPLFEILTRHPRNLLVSVGLKVSEIALSVRCANRSINPQQCDDVWMIWQGELLYIHVASNAAAPMDELPEARLAAGIGIESDRYAKGLGTYSKRPHIDRQVTLIEIEVLEAIARDRGIELTPSEHRRNLTTRGVPLGHLVKQYFRVGECVLYGGRLNVPCLYLETLLSKKVFKPLINRSGLNCRIVIGGVVRKHDRIEWCDPASIDISVRLANEATPLEPPPEPDEFVDRSFGS